LTPDPPHYLRDNVNRLPNLKGSGLKFGQADYVYTSWVYHPLDITGCLTPDPLRPN